MGAWNDISLAVHTFRFFVPWILDCFWITFHDSGLSVQWQDRFHHESRDVLVVIWIVVAVYVSLLRLVTAALPQFQTFQIPLQPQPHHQVMENQYLQPSLAALLVMWTVVVVFALQDPLVMHVTWHVHRRSGQVCQMGQMGPMRLTQLCHISISPLLGCHSALAAVWIVGLVFACLWPPVPTVPVHGLHLLQFLHQVGWFQCIPEYLVALPTTMIVARASVFHTALANGAQLVLVVQSPYQDDRCRDQHQHPQRHQCIPEYRVALPTTMIVAPASVFHTALANGAQLVLVVQSPYQDDRCPDQHQHPQRHQCIPEYRVALATTMIVAPASVFHTALANGVQLVVVQPQPQPQEIQQTQRHQEERFLQQSSDALQTTMIAVPAVVYLEVLASGVVEFLLLQEQTAQMTTILYESRCFQPSRLMVNYESTIDDFYLHVKPASCSDGLPAQSSSPSCTLDNHCYISSLKQDRRNKFCSLIWFSLFDFKSTRSIEHVERKTLKSHFWLYKRIIWKNSMVSGNRKKWPEFTPKRMPKVFFHSASEHVLGFPHLQESGGEKVGRNRLPHQFK